MQIEALPTEGTWSFAPKRFGDDRGTFPEALTTDAFVEAVGHPLTVAQVSCSVSAAGVLRGQAEDVTCTVGAALDVIIDIRVGSPPTYGPWTSALDDVDRRAVRLSEGLGHAFLSLEDGSTVTYLCSTGYDPTGEHGVHPLDPEIGIEWPTVDRDGDPLTFELSAEDKQAPALAQARGAGLLPTYPTLPR